MHWKTRKSSDWRPCSTYPWWEIEGLGSLIGFLAVCNHEDPLNATGILAANHQLWRASSGNAPRDLLLWFLNKHHSAIDWKNLKASNQENGGWLTALKMIMSSLWLLRSTQLWQPPTSCQDTRQVHRAPPGSSQHALVLSTATPRQQSRGEDSLP